MKNLKKKFFLIYLSFNCGIIALQNSVGFCQTSTGISLRGTFVPSLLNLPPIYLPIPLENSLNLIVTTEKLYTEPLTLECELADWDLKVICPQSLLLSTVPEIFTHGISRKKYKVRKESKFIILPVYEFKQKKKNHLCVIKLMKINKHFGYNLTKKINRAFYSRIN